MTGGKDGAVRAWDPRDPSAPVAAYVPADGAAASDCWAVALGNCYNQECCVLAGYQNGDIKMFDLKAASVRWEANVGEGVCGVQVRRQVAAMAGGCSHRKQGRSLRAGFAAARACLSLPHERARKPAAAHAPPAPRRHPAV